MSDTESDNEAPEQVSTSNSRAQVEKAEITLKKTLRKMKENRKAERRALDDRLKQRKAENMAKISVSQKELPLDILEAAPTPVAAIPIIHESLSRQLRAAHLIHHDETHGLQQYLAIR